MSTELFRLLASTTVATRVERQLTAVQIGHVSVRFGPVASRNDRYLANTAAVRRRAKTKSGETSVFVGPTAISACELVALKAGKRRRSAGDAKRPGLIFGFRVRLQRIRDDPEDPEFVALTPDGGAVSAAAVLLRTRVPGGRSVNGNHPVTDHTNDWSIHVRSGDWSTRPEQLTFGVEEPGWLVQDKEDRFGLVVVNRMEVGLLNLKTWVLEHPDNEPFIAARFWRISQPGAGDKLEWPLEASGKAGP